MFNAYSTLKVLNCFAAKSNRGLISVEIVEWIRAHWRDSEEMMSNKADAQHPKGVLNNDWPPSHPQISPQEPAVWSNPK